MKISELLIHDPAVKHAIEQLKVVTEKNRCKDDNKSSKITNTGSRIKSKQV